MVHFIAVVGTLAAVMVQLAAASYSYKSRAICHPAQNTCYKSYRCRLDESIIHNDQRPPSWANEYLQALFANTIAQAKNGSLSMGGTGRFQPEMVCWDSPTRPGWYYQRSSKEAGCQTAWGNLGYHPFGTEAGIWLTLIAGNGTGDIPLEADAFYVSITRVSERRIYMDAYERYDSAKDYLTYRAPGNTPFTPLRTDNDMEANGHDIACCNPGSICYPFQVPGTRSSDPFNTNFTLTHVGCKPIKNDTSPSGLYECPYDPLRDLKNSINSAATRKFELTSSMILSACILLAIILGPSIGILPFW
jgi:hypothetical protein